MALCPMHQQCAQPSPLRCGRCLMCQHSYIIAPTAASVDAVSSDMRRNMYVLTAHSHCDSFLTRSLCRYGAYHVNFLSRLPSPSQAHALQVHKTASFYNSSIIVSVLERQIRLFMRIADARVSCWRSSLRMPSGALRCPPR